MLAHLGPRLLEAAAERHVHRVVDELMRRVRDGEHLVRVWVRVRVRVRIRGRVRDGKHPFHTEDLLARLVHQILEEVLRRRMGDAWAAVHGVSTVSIRYL